MINVSSFMLRFKIEGFLDQIEGFIFCYIYYTHKFFIIYTGLGEMDQGKRICCEVNSLFCYILYRFKKISTSQVIAGTRYPMT